MKNTLVLDVGKSNTRLLLVDAAGELRWSESRPSRSVDDGVHGLRALDTQGLAHWLEATIPQVPDRRDLDRIAITTHGAAFCALGAEGLVLPPIDYEWDGYGEWTTAFEASLANFGHHGTPRLPQGLNAGRQIDYVMRRWPELAAQVRAWVPYPQYWAWWFTGVACSEVSSLGCHTGLWAPAEGRFSDWAQARGLAERFAPLRPAWDVIGSLRPELARRLGLAAEVQVTAGVHDSNACLARHLRHHSEAIVVSTGTWCVVMAPGADTSRLTPDHDERVNVAVDGRAGATARFMGGREFETFCAGADPAWATPEALMQAVAQGFMALPSFADSGGPFRGRRGSVLRQGQRVGSVAAVPAPLRPALAALYCAEVCVQLLHDIAGTAGVERQVILDGPLAGNEAFCAAMATFLQPRGVWRSIDDMEGTARGAWQLARWHDPAVDASQARLAAVAPLPPAAGGLLKAHLQAWNDQVATPAAWVTLA